MDRAEQFTENQVRRRFGLIDGARTCCSSGFPRAGFSRIRLVTSDSGWGLDLRNIIDLARY